MLEIAHLSFKKIKYFQGRMPPGNPRWLNLVELKSKLRAWYCIACYIQVI